MAVKQTVKIEDAIIYSVEPGSVVRDPNNAVLAFSLDEFIDGKRIKVILKGNLALCMWNNFLKDCGTQCSSKYTNGCRINKLVHVNFEGTIKEIRSKEIVLHNIKNLYIFYGYQVEEIGIF